MLEMTNIRQLLDEHEVFEREPETLEQHIEEVLLVVGERRGDVIGRQSRFEDGLFAAWAFCLPIFPQNAGYNRLMRSRRAQWFTDVSSSVASTRAAEFFTTDLLSMELHQLGQLINAPDAAVQVQTYLGEMPEIA